MSSDPHILNGQRFHLYKNQIKGASNKIHQVVNHLPFIFKIRQPKEETKETSFVGSELNAVKDPQTTEVKPRID